MGPSSFGDRPLEAVGLVQRPLPIDSSAFHHQLHREWWTDVRHSRPEPLDAEHRARLFKVGHFHLPKGAPTGPNPPASLLP